MIRTGTIEKAREGRRHHVLPNGTGYWRNGLITSPGGEPVSPQAFLVEQDPNSVIEPHFHQENEFQVVVEGNGFLGRHVVEPVRVHYAGAHTGYGPITAGPKGLSYFTLRARTDSGAQFLPGARDTMQKGPKRHALGKAVPPLAPADLAALRAPETIEIWPPQEDGVCAWMLRIGPNATSATPGQRDTSRYLLVIGGVLLLDGERLPRFATVFARETPALRAADEGVEVLVLQFPFSQEEKK
ncbi:MAG: hypothetical protein ACT4P4_19155 [Betaproteobacteria bacterium]